MEVSAGCKSRSESTADGDERTTWSTGIGGGRGGGSHRLLARLCAGTTGLVVLSGTATAHGPRGHGGEPVAFAVVVGLPIVAGLGGGALAVLRRRVERTGPTRHRAGMALGVLLAVLGGTFAISAVTTSRSLGIAGGAVGAVFALWATRRNGAMSGECHADLTFGAVSAHRLVEGVAIGALYSAGAAVGLLGAALLAGHTAIETVLVGGMYATDPFRTRAIGAILLVQACYAGGAVAGLGVADVLPVSSRALVLSLAGGALLIVGAGEAERTLATG